MNAKNFLEKTKKKQGMKEVIPDNENVINVDSASTEKTSGLEADSDLNLSPFQIYIPRKKRKLNSGMVLQQKIWDDNIILLQKENSGTSGSSSLCTQQYTLSQSGDYDPDTLIVEEVDALAMGTKRLLSSQVLNLRIPMTEAEALSKNTFFLLSEDEDNKLDSSESEDKDGELDSSESPEVIEVIEPKKNCRGRPKKQKRGPRASANMQKSEPKKCDPPTSKNKPTPKPQMRDRRAKMNPRAAAVRDNAANTELLCREEPVLSKNNVWNDNVILLQENSDMTDSSSLCTQATQVITKCSIPITEIDNLTKNNLLLLSEDDDLDSSKSPEIIEVIEPTKNRVGRPKKRRCGPRASANVQKSESQKCDPPTPTNKSEAKPQMRGRRAKMNPRAVAVTDSATNTVVDTTEPLHFEKSIVSKVNEQHHEDDNNHHEQQSGALECHTNGASSLLVNQHSETKCERRVSTQSMGVASDLADNSDTVSLQFLHESEAHQTLAQRCWIIGEQWTAKRILDIPVNVAQCVAAGTMHQGNLGMLQCVAMSTCGAAYSVALGRADFTTDDVDTVLRNANRVYYEDVLRGDEERVIEPEHMVTSFEVGIFKFIIRVEHGFNHLYPAEESMLGHAASLLTEVLKCMFEDRDHDPERVSFLMTGRGETISFWNRVVDVVVNEEDIENNVFEYFIFNSHAVGESGLSDENSSNNRARLFKTDSIEKLAIFLLKKHRYRSAEEYQIHVLRVIEFFTNNEEQEEIDGDSIEENIANSTRKGRPLKPKAGRPKTKENAQKDAVHSYSQRHPEVHREAVRRYTQENPEIHREAVRRYSERHPEVSRITSHNYRNRNPTSLIGEKSGEDLKTVCIFTLKKTKLDTANSCRYCGAKIFTEELTRKQWCCGENRYNIFCDSNILPPLDADFYENPQFVKHARAYNNLFAFSALGVSHGFQHPATGISFLKIQGRIYHRVFDLGYNTTTNPIGLYIDDGEERKRLASNQNLNLSIIEQIDTYLNTVNPFIPTFKRLSTETSEEAFLMFEKTNRRTHGNILGDMPRGNEIAAIICTDRDEYVPRSIAVWNKNKQYPHTIDIMDPLYETFQYPLLYPHGASGWSPNVTKNSIKVSQTKYYRCLLLSESRFSNIGRLSEEWLVDMYCRTEEERLRFLQNRQNVPEQRTAEAAEICEVMNQLNNDETVQGEGGVVPGKIYLPNTFTGAPRYMKTKYMDAMALVNRLGKPSYFLTMTCNPKWPEIVENTHPSYVMASPGIVARVFELKLRQLLNDLKSGKWFGKIEYLTYVIEFQKRGLPHCHMCFRVEGGGPIQNIDIDKFIRADIPSHEEADGKLRDMVLKHMMHGPCGIDRRTDLPCWDDEKMKCLKHFPKPTTETTYVDQRGFVIYKRDSNNKGSITFRNHSISVDDRWVVPYNAALLLKYDCHMNLEISSTRKVIKYLFKYITKGPDEARVAIVPQELINNEIEQYVTKRYIGACNASWRLFEFTLTSREPNVKQLTVHVENRQIVTFRRGQETQAVEDSSSDLLRYFNRPSAPEFDSLTYQDFFEQYVIHTRMPQSSKVTVYKSRDEKYFVTKRQRGEMVTRLFWVAPNRGEQFYLRMLLSAFPCRSYAELKALGGDNCTTFQEVAQVTGLANNEEEYERCIQEAAGFYTGKRLRHFFVLMISNGAPAALLWDKYKQLISEDHLERFPGNEEQAYTISLLEIDRLLRKHGSCLEDHGLPSVQDNSTELSRERLTHDVPRLNSFVEEWLPQLSAEQKEVFDYIKMLLINENVDESATKCVFVDGPSGTGKTLLLNVMTAFVRGVLKKVAVCTASSGIAAQNYEGGSTAHSMFRLPLDVVDDNSYWNITNGTQRAELIREASLIIYDEAPMSHKYLIQLLDRSLRDLMNSSELFGGKIIIFSGDFRQIPPVVPNAKTSNDVLNASLKTSPLWPAMRKFSLKQAQRTRSDEEYSNFLLDLGSGKYNVSENNTFSSCAAINLQGLDVVTQLEDLIDFVFPLETLNNPDICASRAIITTHNNNVREINKFVINRIEGEFEHCFSADSVSAELANEFHLGTDTLNTVQANGVPDHDLVLKKGAVCMIMRNLSFVDGLVNGTKVIITNISPRLLTVRKPLTDDVYLLPRISFNLPIEPGSPVEMCRRQFPVQLCYAMTVHKSQGQTIEKVGVDLRSDVFSHGQLYVALGRVRNKSNLRILLHPAKMIDGIPYTNNVLIPALIN